MKKIRSLAAVAGATTLGLALAACGSSSNDASSGASTSPAATTSSAGSSTDAATVCPSGSLNFGVEPYDDASKLIPAYTTVANDLGKALGCKINLQIAQSYVAEILAMKNGKLDIAEFGPAGYVFASQEAKAVPLVSFADKDGKPSVYTAGIWVKKGSPIKTLKDLAGHTLALGESGSTSGDWEPRYALAQAGLTNSVKTSYAGGHPQAMLALEHGKVDAAEINSQTEFSAEQAKQFDPSQYTEIWKSDNILNDPIAASPSLSATARSAIVKALESLPGSDFTSGSTSIGTELDFTPPANGPAMVPVTQQDYSQLFSLQKALGLTPKDL